MENSICGQAHKCGAFTAPSCTNKMKTENCCKPVPLKPGSNATDRLNELLPEPTMGDCQIGGEKNVPVYEVNGSVYACLDHYVGFVLQKRPMPEKQIQPSKRTVQDLTSEHQPQAPSPA